MQHDLVADAAVFADVDGEARIDVQHTQILDIGAGADLDAIVIAAHNAAKPDADIVADLDVTDHDGIFGHPEAAWPRRLNFHAVEFIKCHDGASLSHVFQVDVEDRHLELIGDFAILVLAVEDRQEILIALADIDLGAVGLFGAGANFDLLVVKSLAQEGFNLRHLFFFHSLSS